MAVEWLRLLGEVAIASFVTFCQCWAQLFRHFIWPKKLKSVEGQVIVVTGAGHGLGRRLACKLAKMGAHVVCWDVDFQRNLNTVWDIRQSNGKATAINCDVTDRAEIFRSVAIVRETVGEVDMLVSCVGIYPVKPTLAWTPEELYALFDTNVMAKFWLLQALVPQMINRGKGHIVFISSAAAIAPVPGELPYSVTKCAVTGLLEGFLEELKLMGHNNIVCTTVHPYYTAVRDDIPVKFDLRFDRLSPDFVTAEIVRGILEEQPVITVPRFMLFWLYMVKLLPYTARKKWRSIFHTRVFSTEDVSQIPNIVDRYKLLPLPNPKPEGST